MNQIRPHSFFSSDPIAEPPQQWFVCDECSGSGEIVRGEWGCEPGCGHRHMIEVGETCDRCGGEGGWIGDVEPDYRP